MIGIIIAGILGVYILAEAYKKYTTPDEKKRWENYVRMHHGEAGAIMTATGIVTKSPTLVGSGIGLMLHDKDDANQWFNGGHK